MFETSVVVRTFNEGKHLGNLLDAIRRQADVCAEIIVVDSGSFDNTCEIAEAQADLLVHVDRSDFTFGYSLNVGVARSSGRFIAIVSAHTKPLDDGWLRSLIEHLQDPDTAMVFGRQLGVNESKFGEVQDFRRVFGTERQQVTFPRFFANNANAAIRRDLWEQHAFDEKLPGLEDAEWAKHWMVRGYRVIYEPTAAISHIHDESWPQVRRRYHREAVAARYLGLKQPKHILPEALRETSYFVGDLVSATREGVLVQKVREIVRFRANKTLGTINGLLDGTAVTGLATRETYLFDRTCKAVMIHGPGRASLVDMQIPSVKPGDVLIKVAYAGVCARDIETLDGTLGNYKKEWAKYPIVPGHEFSGRVVSVGVNAGNVRPGDGVVVGSFQSCGRCPQCQKANWTACGQRQEVGVLGRNGGYAEYVCVPARYVHKVPGDLSLQKASLCEQVAAVLKGLRRLGSADGTATGRYCAIVGAGPIGHLCALILAMRGNRVTVFDRDQERLSYFYGTSVDTSTDLTRLSDYELLVEATGDPEALDSMLRQGPPGSILLLLGLPYAHKDFRFESILAHDLTIVGSVGSSADDFDEAVELVRHLPLDHFIEKSVPMDRFYEAWELARKPVNLKVLVEIDGRL